MDTAGAWSQANCKFVFKIFAPTAGRLRRATRQCAEFGRTLPNEKWEKLNLLGYSNKVHQISFLHKSNVCS